MWNMLPTIKTAIGDTALQSDDRRQIYHLNVFDIT